MTHTRFNKPEFLRYPDLFTPQGQSGTSVPYFTISGGKFCTVNPKINNYSPSGLIRKGGITHTQDTAADYKIQLQWIGSRQMAYNIGGKGPQQPYGTHGFSQDDMRAVAATLPIVTLSADELLEGLYGCPVDAPELVYFYQALADRYAANGAVMRHIGTYGSFGIGQPNYWNYFPFTGGSNTRPTNQGFLNILQSKSGARSISNQHFMIFAPIGIGANIKNYVDRPDYALNYYLKKFETEALCFGYGRVGGLGGNAPVLGYVDWPNIEGIGNNLHGNMKPFRRVDTGAKGYIITNNDDHPVVDNDWRVGCCFVCGYVLMDGCIQFDSPYRFGVNPLNKGTRRPGDQTLQTRRFPRSGDDSAVFNDTFFFEQYRGHDAALEAAWYYNQMAATEGAQWKYVRYQFAGDSTWIEPQTDFGADNGPSTSILYHADAFDGPYAYGQNVRRGRPDVMVRIKNNTAHFFAFDPSIPKYKRETITIQVAPNKTEQITLQGNVLYTGETTIA